MKTPEEIKKTLARCTDDTRCKACLNAYQCDNEAAALAYIQQLEVQVPRWINVEDRLPDTEDNVLVIASGQATETVRMERAYLLGCYTDNEGWIIDGWEEWENPTVHCWMKLPEPPKEWKT